MILTVTLNAAIDKTLAVPNFRLGRRHRSVEQRSSPGGKGVNVARALKALGQPVIATGVAGGPTGTRIIEPLTDEAILSDFVRIQDESRTSTAVVDPTTGEQTEINERGPLVAPAELALFVDKLLYLAKGADICVFSGSLPRGVDADLYASLIAEMRRLDITTVVDSEGDPLRLALRAEPTLVTPNEIEAEQLVGHEFADDDDRIAGVREMVALGAKEAIMTSASGCIALFSEETARSSTGRRSRRSSRSRRSAPAMPSWRATWPPAIGATGRALRPLRGRVRRAVHPALRRRRARRPRGRAPPARRAVEHPQEPALPRSG